MSLELHKVFNPRHHTTDILSAFTKFERKFKYIYNGENRTVPATHTTEVAISDWKDKDKAKLFLSKAVSDEFLDDFESAVLENERKDTKSKTISYFIELVKILQKHLMILHFV